MEPSCHLDVDVDQDGGAAEGLAHTGDAQSGHPKGSSSRPRVSRASRDGSDEDQQQGERGAGRVVADRRVAPEPGGERLDAGGPQQQGGRELLHGGEEHQARPGGDARRGEGQVHPEHAPTAGARRASGRPRRPLGELCSIDARTEPTASERKSTT